MSPWCRSPKRLLPTMLTATKRILDLQEGPTILVGHSYGGSIITEAGVHPKVVGLVYVAAHAPDVGEDEGALGAKTPSVLGRVMAYQEDAGQLHLSSPADFPKLFAPDLPLEEAELIARSQVLAAASDVQPRPDCRRLENEAELGNRRRERPDHRSRS